MNEFDEKAPAWDMNPVHMERSSAIAGLLLKTIPFKPAMTALEYGAGTGLLSILLKDHLQEITLVDNSDGMIRIIAEKVNQQGLANLKPVLLDLEKDPFTGSYDLIFSQMVFHHGVSEI